jgi:uncharacterized protein
VLSVPAGGHGARPNIRILRDVEVPLRDGTLTCAEVWTPESIGPTPAILVRTPYLKETAAPAAVLDSRVAVSRGYALVLQDVRGRGASAGEFEPFVNEESDGYDSVQWVSDQPWCDGRVVMAGMSYVGATQWLAAAARPPALRAIAPTLSADDYGEGWSFTGGVPEYGFLASWCAADLAPEQQRLLDDPSAAWVDIANAKAVAPWLTDWLANGPGSAYWRARSVAHRRADVEVPILTVAGWYDLFLAGSLRAFQRSMGPRDRLIIGPWGHTQDLSHLVGEVNLGVAGRGDAFAGWLLDFYDSVLAGEETATARVRAYMLGRRAWVDMESWPPAGCVSRSIPLDAGSFEVSRTTPVPSLGGRGLLAHTPGWGFGMVDQRSLLHRNDVHQALNLTLTEDTLIAGAVKATLEIEPSAVPTDERMWMVTLCVQRATGELHNIVEGVARASTGARCIVELGDTFTWLPAGSKLVLLISGSSYPRWPLPRLEGQQAVLEGSELTLAVMESAAASELLARI